MITYRYSILKSKENGNIFFFLFILIYSFFLLYLSQNLTIWLDEGFSLNTTSNSLSKVINLSYLVEGQPPVYFIVLSLWRKINDGIFFARLLSIIFTFISAFVLQKISQLIFKEIGSRWLVVIFLLNPYTVWASLEIRLYAFLILLAFIEIYLFYLIYFYNRQKFNIIFQIIGLLGIYTQYYFVFLSIALAIYLLFSKGWLPFSKFCLRSIPIAVLFLPNFTFVGDQYVMHNNTQIHYTIYDRIRYISATPLEFCISIVNLPFKRLIGWGFRIFFIILFIGSLYKLYDEYKKRKFQDSIKICELFIPITIIWGIFIIVYSLSNLTYNNNYMSIAYPFYCILFVVFGIFNKKIKLIVYGIISSYFIIVLINIYKPPYIKFDDSKSLGKFIQHIEYKKEPILIYDNSIYISFLHYYNGRNSLNPLPHLIFDKNWFRSNLKDTIDLKHEIDNIRIDSKSFLLITGNDLGFVIKKTLTNDILDNYLKNNYLISLDTVFKGKKEIDNLRLRRLQKKSNPSIVQTSN